MNSLRKLCVLLSAISGAIAYDRSETAELLRSSRLSYVVPREFDSLDLVCQSDVGAVAWILPDGERVELVSIADEPNRTVERDNLLFSTKRLRIEKVQTDQTGRYSCVLANGDKFHFYIPYVTGRVDMFRAMSLSVGVSLSFAVLFALVILVERVWNRRKPTVAPGDDLMGDEWTDDFHETTAPPRKIGVLYSNAIGYDESGPPAPQTSSYV